MFSLEELEVLSSTSHTHGPHADSEQEDPAAMLEIKEDIRDECSKLGHVTNVVLFDQEQDGVASVRFSDADAATACVQVCLPRLLPPLQH